MNRKYRSILSRAGRAGGPVAFVGEDAVFAAELIGAEFARGVVGGADGLEVLVTGLTFKGRSAVDEYSFRGRVERLYDLLIGVVVGAVTTLVGSLLAKCVMG
jgi:hypothetical protein